MFQSFEIHNWRQIQTLRIKFHDRLTVLTGANGSGKTTILNLLSKHYGWNVGFVGTPRRDSKSGLLEYLPDFWKSLFSKRDSQSESEHVIGQITYKELTQAKLVVPVKVGQTYQIEIRPQHHIKGLHIPSHRPVYTYQRVANIPTQPITKQQAFESYFGEVYQRYLGTGGNRTPNALIKETLLSLATYGYGNQVIRPNEHARMTFENFQEVLRTVLPPKLGFEKLSINVPEVLLETKSGIFSLDAVSGGIASIIDMAWQIFMYSPEREPIVVTIDEPENHLHPELQQILLPCFIRAFPRTQFIIATHNPFIISSVKNSYVYVLEFNKDNKVEGNQLDIANKAGTANEILREVLGLPFTMPIWAEERLETIIRRYSRLNLNNNSLAQLRAELTELGLENHIPDTIAKVIESKRQT